MSHFFYIAATSRTPEVSFDINTKTANIEGECYPEDADKFFTALNKGLEDYFSTGCNELELKINLIYFNSSSARALMELMDSLEGLAGTKQINVNWFYEEGDDITEEFIEDVTSGYQKLKVSTSTNLN
jgi:hypothetical protein